MSRPGVAIWLAWGAAFVGGLAVLAAVYLVVRVDLAAACVPGGRCAEVIDPAVATLAVGGTVVATLGLVVATVLTARRFLHERGPRRTAG